MRYGSVCSGIEAASVAWEPIGWKPAWFAEIEKFPSAVLAHHWPDIDNLGDMTSISGLVDQKAVDAPDVLAGGTPCQAFSVAGMRKSLDDQRGQLTLEFVRLADAIDKIRVSEGKPESIIVWENVPGVLSTKDNAFGCLLGALAGEDCELQPTGKKWPNAGCVFGVKRAVAWRVLDAQYFGVAQRRRRVFVVASARDGFRPDKVLFESEGVRRDTPPRREKGQGFAHDIAPSLTASGRGVERAGESRGQDPVVAVAAEESRSPTLVVHGTQDPCHGADIAFTLGRNNGQENAVFGSTGAGYWSEGFGTLRAREQESHEHLFVTPPYVRRLTPVECERLQGFPDNHTQIPWRRKPSEHCPDGPRYKAIGNSMAVPVMRWIGKRIQTQLQEST